jgi:hypothetical protein
MPSYNAINATVQALGLLVSIIVLVLLVRQLRLLTKQVNDAAKDAAERHIRSQRRETFAFIGSTMPRFHELLEKVPLGEDAYRRLVADAMRLHSRKHRLVRRYLNYLEDLSAGVNTGAFDRSAVYHTVGVRIIRAQELSKQWVAEERKHDDNQELFTELEQCAKHMEIEHDSVVRSRSGDAGR